MTSFGLDTKIHLGKKFDIEDPPWDLHAIFSFAAIPCTIRPTRLHPQQDHLLALRLWFVGAGEYWKAAIVRLCFWARHWEKKKQSGRERSGWACNSQMLLVEIQHLQHYQPSGMWSVANGASAYLLRASLVAHPYGSLVAKRTAVFLLFTP